MKIRKPILSKRQEPTLHTSPKEEKHKDRLQYKHKISEARSLARKAAVNLTNKDLRLAAILAGYPFGGHAKAEHADVVAELESEAMVEVVSKEPDGSLSYVLTRKGKEEAKANQDYQPFSEGFSVDQLLGGPIGKMELFHGTDPRQMKKSLTWQDDDVLEKIAFQRGELSKSDELRRRLVMKILQQRKKENK